MKRGQATIYIILGLVVVLLIAVTLYLSQSSILRLIQAETSGAVVSQIEVMEINTFVESCYKQTFINALNSVGLRGGYYKLPQNLYKESIPFYLIQTRKYIPSNSLVEQQIAALGNYDYLVVLANDGVDSVFMIIDENASFNDNNEYMFEFGVRV